jgi:acetate kinase
VRLLIVNAGSSSLKLKLLDANDSTLAERQIAAPKAEIDSAAVASAVEGELGTAHAVGHRIVHGGESFRSAVRLTHENVEALRALADLAPLHQPKSLAALDAVSAALPQTPAFACFDTAFHATLPPEASTYALPRAWRERWALRRYGFHGLSHAWVARRAPELLTPRPSGARIVSCHLGAGASLCAIRDGVSVDTTMGFTPLEGLVMATRSGSVDPGLVLWLLGHEGVDVAELGRALEHDSGLLGLSGTADMRRLLELAEAGEDAATLARDVYIHRLVASVAAMAASLGGLDAVVFTGGVGERSPTVRRLTAERLGFLGVEVHHERNEDAEPDADISASHAGAAALVLAAREDLEMARQIRAELGANRRDQ